MIEGLLENTLSNILTEAFNKEFSLTSRPRLIALPPKSSHTSIPFISSTNTMLAHAKKTPTMEVMSVHSPVSPTLSVTKSIDMMSNIIKTEPFNDQREPVEIVIEPSEEVEPTAE